MSVIDMHTDTITIKSANADLLNRLYEMQQSPYYAAARKTLSDAELTIVRLEREQLTVGMQKAVRICRDLIFAFDNGDIDFEVPANVQKWVRALDTALLEFSA